MATWIVGGVLVLIVGAIARKMLKDKKSGKSSCGGDCAHCHGCGGKTLPRRPEL